MESEEGRVYTDLGRQRSCFRLDPGLKKKDIKEDQKRNNGSKGIKAKYYSKYDEAFCKKKKNRKHKILQ